MKQHAPSPTVRLQRGSVALLLLSSGAIAAVSSCDTNAKFNLNTVSYESISVVSAYPAVRSGNDWVRQCTPGSTHADGFFLNVVFKTTRVNVALGETSNDTDRSVHPNDRVEVNTVEGPLSSDVELSSPTHYELNIDCIEPYPDGDYSDKCHGADRTGSSPPALNAVSYKAFGGRESGSDVMILIDQSGSIKGLVDATTKKESPNAIFGKPINDASDYNNLRLSAVRVLINELNPSDRVGVVGFGEQTAADGTGLRVPCDDPTLTWEAALDKCYGTNHNFWVRSDADSTQADNMDALQASNAIGGRSNLWTAVSEAYGYLGKRGSVQRPAHIIVVADGPDTCAQNENATACLGRCASSTANYDDLVTRINNANADANAVKPQIHFVQFESSGYAGVDPRQVEAACLTQGHYQYINSNTMPTTDQGAAFQAALENALLNVRFSLLGMWQFAVTAPGFADTQGAPQGSPAGYVYGLEGTLRVKASTKLKGTADAAIPDSEGLARFTQASLASYDKRPILRKPCATATDCGGNVANQTACHAICSPEAKTCLSAATGVDLPDTTSCQDGGTDGFCCQGTCDTTNGKCTNCP